MTLLRRILLATKVEEEERGGNKEERSCETFSLLKIKTHPTPEGEEKFVVML